MARKCWPSLRQHLAATVGELHRKLNGGGEVSPGMLHGILVTLEELTQAVSGMLEHEGEVRKAVRRVARDNQRVSAAQELLARATQQGLTAVKRKAVRRVARDNQRVSAAQELLARATQQGLTAVKKSLAPTGTPPLKVRKGTPTPAPDPRLNADLVKKYGQNPGELVWP